MRSFLLVLVVFTTVLRAEPLTRDRVVAAAGELERLTTAEMAKTGVPGIALAVVYRGEVIAAKGVGIRAVGSEDLVDADTAFQMASLSKPVGSTVVAALVGEKVVSWDSRISDLDPGFALHDPWVTQELTIRDLYAHRSGLPDHAGDLLEDLGYDRAEVLYRLREQKPATSFRSGYAYTNFGLTEGALAAAKAAGKEWEEISEEVLYRPLGLTATSSRYADFAARKNRALGHVQEDGKWVQKFQRQPDAQTPAGGVSSSVNDMAKWMILQLAGGKFDGRQIVAEDALAETHQPVIFRGLSQSGQPSFYGLGWNVAYDGQGRLRLSHSGAFESGAATAVFLVPAEQLGVMVLTNAFPIGLAEGLAAVFLDTALYGTAQQDWMTLYRKGFAQMMEQERAGLGDYVKPPAKPQASADLSAYEGVYRNDFFGDAVVAEKEGRLVLTLGPKKTYPLTHWNRDVFTYETDGENAVGKAGVFFSLDGENKAISVEIENLNREGQGVFRRDEGETGRENR